MIVVDAIGDACPIPVVKARKAIKEMAGAGKVCVLVDNDIAAQNLKKMAAQLGYGASSRQEGSGRYEVLLTIGNAPSADPEMDEAAFSCDCEAPHDAVKKGKLVVITSDCMGEGDPALGRQLLKGFIFAIAQLDELPEAMLFYNAGARMTCAGSAALEDLLLMAGRGVEILTCGTCLNHYGLTEKLSVGGVTNMYVIAEKMLGAGSVIKP